MQRKGNIICSNTSCTGIHIIIVTVLGLHLGAPKDHSIEDRVADVACDVVDEEVEAETDDGFPTPVDVHLKVEGH